MCYRVYTHTLKCDVRPVLCDGRNMLIDPYASPIACTCRPDNRLPSRSICDRHGCCVLTVRTYNCPRMCRDPVIYNIYVQRHSPRGVHFKRPERDPSWRNLPIFDGSIFPITSTSDRWGPLRCRSESVDFRFARDQMLEAGRILDHATLEIDKALYDARKHRAWHRRQHGSCEHTARGPQCEWKQKIINIEEHADNLEVAVEGFERLWLRWKLYVRKLEKKGDRRLGGLEEWHRRDGRSGEQEEFEHLNNFYKRDMRVDEMDAIRAKQRDREMERERERYLAKEQERRRTEKREREREAQAYSHRSHRSRGHKERTSWWHSDAGPRKGGSRHDEGLHGAWRRF